MPEKKKRPKSDVIKGNAALVLKQISNYRSDLPVGDLRDRVKKLEDDAEQFVIEVNNTFPALNDTALDDD